MATEPDRRAAALKEVAALVRHWREMSERIVRQMFKETTEERLQLWSNRCDRSGRASFAGQLFLVAFYCVGCRHLEGSQADVTEIMAKAN